MFGALKTLSTSYRDACIGIVELARHLQEYYEEAEEHYPEVRPSDDLVEKAHALASDVYSGSFGRLSGSGIELIPLTKKRDSGCLSTGQVNKKARQT